MFHHEKDIVEYYSQYLKLYKRFIDDIFAIWCGPKGTLLEFLNALNSKTDWNKQTYCTSESSISFLDLFLYRDTSSNVLQFSTFEKPLNWNICTYHSSRFALLAIRNPSLKGNYMLETVLLYETREKFWKWPRVRGYPFRFLLSLFREIRYSRRKKWLHKKPKNRSSLRWDYCL